MNTSLGLFDPLFIIPLLQSSYILFGVISGGIYFEEFAGLHNGPAGAGGWPLFILGMLCILSGLALIAPPPSQGGLPTADAPGPRLRKHRNSKEGPSPLSSSTRPSDTHSPRTRTSPRCAGGLGRAGEKYAAACTDSAAGTSGITLSRLADSRSPLAPMGNAADDDALAAEDDSNFGDSVHGGSRLSDPGSDEEAAGAPVHLSSAGRLEKLTKAVGRTAAGTVGSAAAGAVSAVGSVGSAAVGAVGVVGSAMGSAVVGGSRQCAGSRPPPLAASDRAADAIGPGEVTIALEEGEGQGRTPVMEDLDDAPGASLSPPRSPPQHASPPQAQHRSPPQHASPPQLVETTPGAERSGGKSTGSPIY
jgi:hypothetical protein